MYQQPAKLKQPMYKKNNDLQKKKGFTSPEQVVTPGSFMDLFHATGKDLRGEVLALDALSGELLWKYPVKPYDGGPIGMTKGPVYLWWWGADDWVLG